MPRLVTRFTADDAGATAIEYGLIAALIAVALIGAFTAFGTNLTGLFTHVQTDAGGAMENAGI
jgi:pilus assembly protein Flp/PilA